MPTPAGEAAGAAFVDDIAAVASAMIDESAGRGEPVGGIGIGVCELVTPDGSIASCHRLPWYGLKVAERLAAIGPAVIESDVRAAAIAEARYGAGSAADPIYYLNIGTGISGCLVQGGIAYRGARGNALVVGSMASLLELADGEQLEPLSLEQQFGGGGLVDAYCREGFTATTSALQVLAAAEQGEPVANRIVGSAAHAIGVRLGLVIDLLDPAMVVVGGGIAAAAGPFWPALIAATRHHIWSTDTRLLAIERAAFGARSGVVGAAIVAADRLAARRSLLPRG